MKQLKKSFIGLVLIATNIFKGYVMLDIIKNWWHDLQIKIDEILADEDWYV